MYLQFFTRRPAITALVAVTLCMTLIPVAAVYFILGAWPVFPPTFTDETYYFAHVQNIAEGHLADGNPYLYEHRDAPPIVLFGGAWINALPLALGVPFMPAMMLNFIVWSLVFVGLCYWLFREFSVYPWVSAGATLFLYVQSYTHIFRPANLQTVWPAFLLFYIALARLLKEQSRTNILLLGITAGASFYLFAYLWQAVVITLGLLALYALVQRDWSLLKAALYSSAIGGVIGVPVPLYMFWLSHSSPYFWESMERFGLVHTHIPMAEIVYSGGWVGVVLALVALLYWKVTPLRYDREFIIRCVFVAVGGLGLWILQGSNLVTGLLSETGEHVRTFIVAWLWCATVILGAYLFAVRARLTVWMRAIAVFVLLMCLVVSAHFLYDDFRPYLELGTRGAFWQEEQTYAPPLQWLEEHEQEPVVVWSDPHEYLSPNLPIFTRHYTLFATFAMFHLLPTGEFVERYLVSQYFDNPTAESLRKDAETYMGRADIAHKAKTIEREVKVCRLLFFWRTETCGEVPAQFDPLGEDYFNNLERRFREDIKPNIKAYLKKYNVSYILTNKTSDPQYRPETLGAKKVYEDTYYALYRLP